MKQFFISLISHCEKIWWDPGYEGLKLAIQAMLDLQQRVGQCLSTTVTSTFCTFVDHPTVTTVRADAVEVPDSLYAILAAGNEIGLHVHAPTTALHTGLQDRLIAADAELIATLGLPRPVTYAAGDFVTSPQIVSILEQAGFQVDCSVYNLEGTVERFGVEVDHVARANLQPYHPHHDDLGKEGRSSLVELPVSGYLPEFGGTVYPNLPSIEKRIHIRYDQLTTGIDIFQIFWHPFEILTLDGKDNAALLAHGLGSEQGRGTIGINQKLLEPFETFLRNFGQRSNVEIASAIHAAECWKNHRNSR